MKENKKEIILDQASSLKITAVESAFYFSEISSLIEKGKTSINDPEVKETKFYKEIQDAEALHIGRWLEPGGRKLLLFLDIAATSSTLRIISFKELPFSKLQIDTETVFQKFCHSNSVKKVYFYDQSSYTQMQKDNGNAIFDKHNKIIVDKEKMFLFFRGTLNTVENNKNSEFSLSKDAISHITSFVRFNHIKHNLSKPLHSGDSSSKADFKLHSPIENDVGLTGGITHDEFSIFDCTIL